MPNRIIKESAFESEKIATLSDFEFRLWVGLITQADDAGRGDARPAIIKGHVFVLRERVTVRDIESALHALAAAGCVSLYKVGGKPYYQFPGWAKHQRVRDCKPKYPGPDEADMPQLAADCGNSPQLAADCGSHARPRAAANPNPIQSNPNPNPNPNPTRARGDALSVFGEWAKQFAEGETDSSASLGMTGFAHDLAAALADFAQMRKTIRKPLTQRAAELICQKLEKDFRREDWIPVLNQSVENSWQGLFPLKEDGDAAGNGRRYDRSGGVSKRLRDYNAQCQKHGADPSPAMLDAVKQMLEEDV